MIFEQVVVDSSVGNILNCSEISNKKQINFNHIVRTIVKHLSLPFCWLDFKCVLIERHKIAVSL